MKQRVFAVLLGMMLALSATTMTFAEDVYVTKYGKKYHKADSHYIEGKEGVEKLSREEAEELGYEPSREFLKAEMALQKEDPSVSESE